MPDNHAVLNELPEAARKEGGKKVAGDHKVQNKETEGISWDVHLPGGPRKFLGTWNCEFQILGKCLAGRRLEGFGNSELPNSGGRRNFLSGELLVVCEFGSRYGLTNMVYMVQADIMKDTS